MGREGKRDFDPVYVCYHAQHVLYVIYLNAVCMHPFYSAKKDFLLYTLPT